MTTRMPSEMGGFQILSLSLPTLPSFPEPATHYLYFRPDEPKIAGPKTARTLFLVNIPIDTTNVHLKHLFSVQLDLPAGRIEDVEFESDEAPIVPKGPAVPELPMQNKGKKRKRGKTADDGPVPELPGGWPEVWDRTVHRSGSTASVVFIDRASMDAAFKAAKRAQKTNKKIVWGEGVEDKVPALGYERYLEHHKRSYPPKAELLQLVNDYMTAYGAREAARVKALTRQRSEPDEDGFITVARGGRNGPAKQEEAAERLERQKERQKGYEDFYRFQSREKRKEKANELVRKFEEDKERIREMKAQRHKFRPE